MYARFTTVQMQPDKAQEATDLYANRRMGFAEVCKVDLFAGPAPAV